jgi:hypothetical protein
MLDSPHGRLLAGGAAHQLQEQLVVAPAPVVGDAADELLG